MIIAFVHNNKPFWPELDAYCRFFSGYHITCEIVDKNELRLVHRHVEWWLMGMDLTKPKEGIFKIHEYASSSRGPWRGWKNWSKGFFSAQPDFRLFLNEYVKKTIGLHDQIPFGFRNMGVPTQWLNNPTGHHEKEYDFVYTGDLSPIRHMEKLLNCFSTGPMSKRTLLLIGKDYGPLQTAYARYPNIVFMGPLPHNTMNTYISKARFGINYIINTEPFNQQTSIKLLEYAALGLPVISTRYAWVEQFEQRYGGKYFYLEPDWSNFTWDNVISFNYAPPNLANWTWDYQIRHSGVLEFLQAQFPELEFNRQ